ncbi:hypothetical protein [Thalassoglobus neptunius]|nr:hypothetical protein [Thalassoglobus neptunius]
MPLTHNDSGSIATDEFSRLLTWDACPFLSSADVYRHVAFFDSKGH